jgi:hypothetical protein
MGVTPIRGEDMPLYNPINPCFLIREEKQSFRDEYDPVWSRTLRVSNGCCVNYKTPINTVKIPAEAPEMKVLAWSISLMRALLRISK